MKSASKAGSQRSSTFPSSSCSHHRSTPATRWPRPPASTSSSFLISTFGLDEKKKAEALFGELELAARMDADASLAVRVFANIHRKYQDETPSAALIREFATRFRDEVWPGKRLPEVFYDPRSLEIDAHKKAVLHAKAVVIDARWILLTSANFTEAAHERNIEAGVVVDDTRLAERVTRQFDQFVEAGVLRRVGG